MGVVFASSSTGGGGRGGILRPGGMRSPERRRRRQVWSFSSSHPLLLLAAASAVPATPLVGAAEALKLAGILPQKPQPLGLSQDQIVAMARRRFLGDGGGGSSADEEPMTGTVVVVTGAAGGIGGQVVRTVHRLGGTVVALDRNADGLADLETAVLSPGVGGNGGRRIWPVVVNQEDLSSVARAAGEIGARFGRIDMLVNNAGLSYSQTTSQPGSPEMKAANGRDLLFVVNYLSHFLLTELLLPNLSRSEFARIVHVTSTFHWKVDGSELLSPGIGPGTAGGGGVPAAYESDPSRQGPDHVGRSYANSKLAQIWHSRAVAGLCPSVCACPTWAATGIAGEEGRDFLSRFAFPVDGCGPGVTSTMNAMLRTDGELGDALGVPGGSAQTCFVANCCLLDIFPFRCALWVMSGTRFWPGFRTAISGLLAAMLLLLQRSTYREFVIQGTSPESGDQDMQSRFYEWSLEEVRPWLQGEGFAKDQ